MIPGLTVDPTGNASAPEWLFVAVPTIGLIAVIVFLVLSGDPQGRMGLFTAPLARAASSLRRVTGLPAWCIGGIGMQMWALLVAGLGFYWDVAWHIDFGRDRELFTPPHTLILMGLLSIVAAGLVSIAFATVEHADTGWRLRRLRVPYGAVPMLACGLGAFAGFPLDDLWHRNYGIDVTMWGPTHLMMIGGGCVAPFASWLLYAEAGAKGGARALRPGLRRTLAGGLLLSLSAFQLEFDLGVPQWQMLYQPVLIALACGLGMVAARVAMGRGWALIVAVNFVISRAIVALVVGPGLGHTMPRFPLYLGSALVVEGVFWAGERRGLRPLQLASLSGLGVGTLGLATEWGFSHLWGLQPWQPSLLTSIWAATAIAVAAAVVGFAMGRVLGLRSVGVPRAALIAAGVSAAGLLVVPLPRSSAPISALERMTPVGPASTAVDRNGDLTVKQEYAVDLQLSPAGAADGADIFRVLSWQGGGLRNTPLVEVGLGHWRSDGTVPTGGTWKAMVGLVRRDLFVAAPVALPADRQYGQSAVAPAPVRTVEFVPASRWLMRETHGGAAWPAILAYSGLLGVTVLWVGLLVVAFRAVSQRHGGGSARRILATMPREITPLEMSRLTRR